MKSIKLFIVLFSSFFIFSCSLLDSEPSFYKERRENHKFFRCEFNGEEWTYSFVKKRWNIIGLGYSKPNLESIFYKDYEGSDYLKIYANRRDDEGNKSQTIEIIFNGDLKIGKNKMKNIDDPIVRIRDKDNSISDYYYLDFGFDNFLNIEEIDEDNGIIKGTFQFRGVTEDGKRTVKVMDGEFDLKIDIWRPIPFHHEFKCKINGEEWEVEQYFDRKTNLPLSVWYKNEKRILKINASVDIGRFRFIVNDINSKGEIKLEQKDMPIFTESYPKRGKFYLDNNYNNILNILEFNSNKEFVKGTFDFRAFSNNGYKIDTITVINGFFDSKYKWVK